jgi:hypothetical protein
MSGAARLEVWSVSDGKSRARDTWQTEAVRDSGGPTTMRGRKWNR